MLSSIFKLHADLSQLMESPYTPHPHTIHTTCCGCSMLQLKEQGGKGAVYGGQKDLSEQETKCPLSCRLK